MKVICVTHGAHEKRGNEPDTYDGPLKEESWKALRKMAEELRESPEFKFDVAYRGLMNRHYGSAEALCLQLTAIPEKAIGWDEDMFLAMEGSRIALNRLREFLKRLKEEGCQSVLLITSRFTAIALKFAELGGEEKLGIPFQYFLRTMDVVSKWNGPIPEILISGKITTFEF